METRCADHTPPNGKPLRLATDDCAKDFILNTLIKFLIIQVHDYYRVVPHGICQSVPWMDNKLFGNIKEEINT